MKRISVIILFSLPFALSAQNKPLMIEGVAPNLYLTHTVAPKENYYSIGRMYNISPKEIAPFNNAVLEKGLSLNQVIKVPMITSNFIQANDAAADEVLVPVYHTVKEKEGLYRITINYNKLPLETLKKWNNIKGDAVSNGTQLIVGYLKVKKELSPLSGMAKAMPAATTTTTVAVVKPATTTEVAKETVPVVKTVEKPKVTVPAPTKEKKPEPVVVKEKPVITEPIKEKPVAKEPVVVATQPVRIGKNFNGGFFKPDYDKQSKKDDVASEEGAAAIFRSTSGWEDGKYYCLHNAAAPGSIIKITSKSTGKSVYAKVLDVIPDIKQNNDLLIRLSNAAASELGVAEGKFDCTLAFTK